MFNILFFYTITWINNFLILLYAGIALDKKLSQFYEI